VSDRRTFLLAVAWGLALAAGLWLLEIRPQFHEDISPWPGHPQGFRQASYLPGDCPYYRAATASLLSDGDLDLRNNAAWNVLPPDGQVSLGQRGEWFPKHPVALSLVAVPFYALGGDRGLLAFNLLQLLALDLLLLYSARRVASTGVALVVASVFALGTLLRPVALNFSPDVLSTCLVFGGVLAAVQRRPALAGALLGAAVAAKWTNLIFLPAVALWMAGRGEPKGLARFGLAAAPFLAGLALLNAFMFGSPWVTPYDRVGVGLLSGAPRLEVSHRSFFDVPLWTGLVSQLTDSRSGLFASAPPLLLSLPGYVVLWRRRPQEAALFAGLSLAQVFLFAPYRMWDASNYGHRFLLTVVVLGAAPAAALLDALLQPRQTSLP